MQENSHKNQGQNHEAQDHKNVVMNALGMALGTMTSRVLGLVRESAFAALFDKQITDAFAVAFRLPNLFRRLLGEGSLSVSFIPVFVESRLDENPARATNLVNSFYTLLLLFLSVLTTLGIVFAQPILELWLNVEYVQDIEKFALTVRMAQIMFGFIFLMSTYAFFMGVLNALGSFALAALAPTLWNIAMVISTLLPTRWFSSPGDGLAMGVMVGGVLQTAVLIPSLRRKGYFPKLSLDFKNPDVNKVLRNMVPGLFGMGLLQFTTIVNLSFLSRLNEGSISFVNYVDRLIELPLSLISVSLGTALLPTLSGMWSRGEKERMRDTSQFYLRVNLFVCIPAALGLMALAYPIIELLFLRGRFQQADALATAQILQAYAWIMVFTSSVRVLTPSFYAIKNTTYPAVVSAICLTVHIFLAPILMEKYQLIGLLSSTTTSAALNFLLLILAYPRWIGRFDFLKLMGQVTKFFIAGFVLYFSSREVQILMRELLGSSFAAKTISLFMAISVGAGIYMLLAYVFKFEEFSTVFGTLISKIRRRLKF